MSVLVDASILHVATCVVCSPSERYHDHPIINSNNNSIQQQQHQQQQQQQQEQQRRQQELPVVRQNMCNIFVEQHPSKK